MKKSKNKSVAAMSTLSLLLGAAPFAGSISAGASELLAFRSLGSAGSVRASLLGGSTGSESDTPATSGEKKAGEAKCGEGKCGEGKCGEGKSGDKAKAAESKTGSEAKCGEGKCG